MKEHFSALNKGQPAFFLFSTVTPLVAALLLFPSPGATLECFNCNSFTNSSCKAGDLSIHKMTCSSVHQGCRKWFFSFDAKGDGNLVERVVRECAMTVTKDMCQRGFGASGQRFKREICECKSDNCNTAATIKINLITIFCIMLSLMILV